MTTIGARKANLYAKVVTLILFAGLFLTFGCLLVGPFFNNLNHDPYSLLVPTLVMTLLAFLSTATLIQLFFIPIGVEIYNAKEIRLIYFFGKPDDVAVTDIEKYAVTKIYSKGGNEDGIIIHLISGRKILLSNFSLKTYMPVKLLLDEAGINNIGKEKFSIFPYYAEIFRKMF